MKVIASVAALLLVSVAPVAGHARWKCPPPRDASDANGKHILFSNTGNKQGPCGPDSGMYGFNGVTELRPGWQTFVWEESIAHAGSPFRLAILDANETEKIILLDHIPHWDASKPVAYVEPTYVDYKITAYIPDIDCPQCSIQLIFFMTDKTTKCFGADAICTYYPEDSACSGQIDPSEPTCFGAPNDTPCKLQNTCFSNYHSCTDVKITGTKPVDEIEYEVPVEWPYSHLSGFKYTSEAAEWKDGWLKGIPSNFTTLAGVCGI